MGRRSDRSTIAAVSDARTAPIRHDYRLRSSAEHAFSVYWGEMTIWETGHRLAHTFILARDPRHPSEVAVEFVPADDHASTLRFAHGGWTDANIRARNEFADWPLVLDRFASLTDSDA